MKRGRMQAKGVARARRVALRTVREAELEGAVIKLARLLGFRVAHFRPAVLPSGRWATHMRGDKGFPDLTLAKRGRLIFAELKRVGEDPTEEQVAWLEVLGSVPGVEAVLWDTEDWASGAIEAALRREDEHEKNAEALLTWWRRQEGAEARPRRRRRRAGLASAMEAESATYQLVKRRVMG